MPFKTLNFFLFVTQVKYWHKNAKSGDLHVSPQFEITDASLTVLDHEIIRALLVKKLMQQHRSCV